MVSTATAMPVQRKLKGHVGRGVRRAFQFFYPPTTSRGDLFADYITRYLSPDTAVLDAGCGSGSFFNVPSKDDVQLLVGCDISDGIWRNQNIDAGIYANLAKLPIESETFDVIYSRYVMEHLDAPEAVFSELTRVLKPGGRLIILTPSKYHYVSFFSRMLPHWIHERVSVVRGNAAHDAFPTRYLANSRGDLARYAKQAGLVTQAFITHEAPPSYLLWSLPSFLLGVAFERLVNTIDLLAPLRSSILAVFSKELYQEAEEGAPAINPNQATSLGA